MNMSENQLVFVYGTLKSGQPNYTHMLDSRNGQAVFVSKARTVDKWPLVIASKYNIPYLLKCEGQGHHIVGEVYEVDIRMLDFLDEFEGHPGNYLRSRIEVILEMSGSPMECWTYILVNYNSMLELPFYEDYSSTGPHGLEYVPKNKRTQEEHH